MRTSNGADNSSAPRRRSGGEPGGHADSVGSATRFRSPRALSIGSDGNLVAADTHCIRQVTPSGENTDDNEGEPLSADPRL